MAQILRFKAPDHSFDPETLVILGAAYDRAVAGLHNTGQPKPICELLAERIMAAALGGERDIDILCKAALHGIT